MTGRSEPMPRWAQIFLIPAALIVVYILGHTIGHVLFVFTVSVVVALLLHPIVRLLRRAHIPRGLAVLLVYLSLLGAVTGAVLLVINPVRSQVEDIQQNLPIYTDKAQREVQNLQEFLNRHGIDVNLQEKTDSALDALRERASEYASNIVTYSLDILNVLITFIIIVVASIYMLLDAPRIARFAQRIGGPGARMFLRRTELTLTEYVKAQLLVSLIIAVSAGALLWIYGVTGLFPLGADYAAAFAAWVFVMEFVPYVGPLLGAVPPVLLALFTSPITALWVALGFLAIHQFEGHVVVPNIMGSAVGVHPLVVIFGLLVGQQLYGLAGILLAVPMVVIIKEAVLYAAEHLRAAPAPAPAPPAPAAEDPPPERDATTRVVDAPTLRPGEL
jgi:predicted PurR-regulated permease PerM